MTDHEWLREGADAGGGGGGSRVSQESATESVLRGGVWSGTRARFRYQNIILNTDDQQCFIWLVCPTEVQLSPVKAVAVGLYPRRIGKIMIFFNKGSGQIEKKNLAWPHSPNYYLTANLEGCSWHCSKHDGTITLLSSDADVVVLEIRSWQFHTMNLLEASATAYIVYLICKMIAVIIVVRLEISCSSCVPLQTISVWSPVCSATKIFYQLTVKSFFSTHLICETLIL